MRMLTWNDDLALVAQRFTLNKLYLISYRIPSLNFYILIAINVNHLYHFKFLDGLINAQDDPMMSIEEQTNINSRDKITPGEVRQQKNKNLKF